MMYKMKESIINGFLYFGRRPDYFNEEGAMDSILRGDMFMIDDATNQCPIVILSGVSYMVSRDDIIAVDMIDNRSVEDV